MARKCDLCGKNASFTSGGSKYRGKTLCFDCYERVIRIKDEEEMKAMGFNSVEEGSSFKYEGQIFIIALRALACLNLLGTFIFSMIIWSDEGSFSSGFMNLMTGAIIFTVLYVFSILVENVIAIRMNLESKKEETEEKL